MKLKAKINELGPLKGLTVEMNQTVLLVGDSGLGKSYTAYLFQFMSGFFGEKSKTFSLDLVLDSFVRKQMKKYGEYDLYENLLKHDVGAIKANDLLIPEGKENKKLLFHFSFSDFAEFMKEEVKDYMINLVGDIDLECDVEFMFEKERDEEDVDGCYQAFIYKRELEGKNGKQCVVLQDNNGNEKEFQGIYGHTGLLEDASLDLIPYLTKSCSTCRSHTLFFPSDRGAFLYFPRDDARELIHLDLYTIFLRDMTFLQAPREKANKDCKLYSEIVKDFLGGYLRDYGDGLCVNINDDCDVAMTAAAASERTLLPLLLLLKNHGDHLADFSVLFEDPEIHLHPTKQVQVVDLLAKCMAEKCRFVLTTNSDVFLKRINQLIRLGNIKEQSEAEFKTFCTEHNWDERLVLDKKKVSAYYFSTDVEGGAKAVNFDVTDGVPFDTLTSFVDEQLKIDGWIDALKEKTSRY